MLQRVLGFVWQRKWLIGAGAIVILGFGLAPNLAKKEKPIRTEPPLKRNLTKFIEVPGFVDAETKVNLRFVAGGKVVYVGAQEGDFVKKWQTIAKIDQRDLQARLEKNLNLYMNERWDWEQTLDDTKDRAIPKA